MFFSEDLLSSKKGSFGIVWLAATLGPRTKRITRKQLTSVDLNRTCELIAEPPEPMALRLSGCLLVGVARVYHQNYDLFYSASPATGTTAARADLQDVTKFHSDLRRMVVSDFGGQSGLNGQPAGLDLVGDGKARVDQITFGGEDISWLSGIDLGLLKMDWDQPDRASRKRRMSTQLSSLQSQQRPERDSDEDDDSQQDSEDETESILTEEGREAKKKRMTSSPYGPRQNKGRRDRISSDGGIHDILPDAPELFPEFSSQDGFLPSAAPTSDPLEPNDMVMPDFPAEIMDDFPPLEPTSMQVQEGAGGENPGGSKGDAEERAEEVPPQKVKKPKKAKKVQYDDDLELEEDVWRGRTYNDDMQRERSEQVAKDKLKGVEERASALVDGAGLWVEFIDPDMSDFFASCAKPGKFQWERDGRNDDLPEVNDVQNDQDQAQLPIMQDDPFLVNDFTNDVQHHDFSIPIQDVTGREGSERPESEVGRRKSQPMPESQANLPWADASDDFEALPSGDDFTPGTRLSLMTPLEKRIRSTGSRDPLHERGRRERSPSVPGGREQDAQPLVPDSQANDYLEDDPFATQNLPQSQLRPELPHAFQPHMLATLEVQCRNFMTFTEKRMRQGGVDEIDFGEIIEDRAGKRIAALAFYNCLTLATKKILSVAQPVAWDSITVRFTADL